MPARRVIVYPQGGGAPSAPTYNFATDITRLRHQARAFSQIEVETQNLIITGSSDTATASLNGTTIPPAALILDNSLNEWTVSGGIVYQDSVPASFTSGVILLLWWSGTIYQENGSNQWFSWNGTAWISAPGDPRLLTPLWSDPLPNGTVGVPYSFTLTATNGVPPYTFSIASGSLPAGLTLNTSTGLISGTPTAAANMQAVSFTVTDSG